jgi:integrase
MSAIAGSPAGALGAPVRHAPHISRRDGAEILDIRHQVVNRRAFSVLSLQTSGPGKAGRRELPRPTLDALRVALSAFGQELETMSPEESLWPSQGHTGGLSSATFYEHLRRYLKKAGIAPAGVHILRHTAAKLRRDAGESIEDVSRFLDHSSLAVTTVYLRRLEGQEDCGWGRVAEAIGV